MISILIVKNIISKKIKIIINIIRKVILIRKNKNQIQIKNINLNHKLPNQQNQMSVNQTQRIDQKMQVILNLKLVKHLRVKPKVIK